MKNPFARRPAGLPPVPAHAITDKPERHIAVGSLAGIAPSDIHAHVLLVVTEGGDLSITGTACDAHAAAIVASASQALAMRALAAHLHNGSPE